MVVVGRRLVTAGRERAQVVGAAVRKVAVSAEGMAGPARTLTAAAGRQAVPRVWARTVANP